MKIEDLCLKIIKEFFVNVDTTTQTEKVHFSLGILSLAKKLDPHNKAINTMLAEITSEIELLNARADFLEYFFRLLYEMTDGKADSVNAFYTEIEGRGINGEHAIIKIDYKSESVEE